MKSFHTSIAILIVLILMLIGVLSASASIFNEPQRTSKEFTYYMKKNTTEFEVKYKGTITVSDNDKDIKSISPNGYLIIEQSSFGNSKKIEIISDASGNLTRKYFDGKSEGNYDTEGREWLASMFPNLIYQTAIGGADRIIRIYNTQGISAAIKEAENMKNSGGNRRVIIMGYTTENISTSSANYYLYYKALLDKIKMNDDELELYIEALREVRSNSTKGSLLREVINKYKLTPNLMEELLETTATLDYNVDRGNTLRLFQSKYSIDKSNYREYFEVIDGININSEKGNVLKPLLKSQKLDPKVFIALCESLKKFTNHSETAAVLRVASQYIPDNSEAKEAFRTAVESLASPYKYLAQELKLLYEDPDYLNDIGKVDKKYLLSTLKQVKLEKPNTTKTTTLRKLHSSMVNDPEVIEAYFEVIESMDNNMEIYNVLLELVNNFKLNEVGYIALYYVAEELAKDDYKHGASAIIRASLLNIPNNKEVHDQLFDALEEIDHNSGREEIIRLITSDKIITDNLGILKMLRIAGKIDAEIEKSISLVHIAKILPSKNEEVSYLYKRLADELESEYEYDRAIYGLNK